jgi:hypothetical protein
MMKLGEELILEMLIIIHIKNGHHFNYFQK